MARVYGATLDESTSGPAATGRLTRALAIESSSEWITTDRDFSRFLGLQWRHPLAPAR
ncbi:MAG: hypothetical protein ACR2H7_11825 [Actinomycetota bacterium]